MVETSNSAWHGALILYNNAYENFTRVVLLKIIYGILGYPVTLKINAPLQKSFPITWKLFNSITYYVIIIIIIIINCCLVQKPMACEQPVLSAN